MRKPKTERVCIGYRPATGWPRDKDGKLILIYDFADVPIEPPEPEPTSRRGVQDLLI